MIGESVSAARFSGFTSGLLMTLLASMSLGAAESCGVPLWEQQGLLSSSVSERRSSAARWLWRDEIPTAPGSECFFRYAFVLPSAAVSAKFACRTDDFGWIYLNGKEISVHQFQSNLCAGRNVLAVKVKNSANVAGLLFAADIVCANGEKVRLVSDRSVKVSESGAEGWSLPNFDDSSWALAIDQGDVLQVPWSTRFDYTRDYATDEERAAIEAERKRIEALPDSLAEEPDPQAVIVTEGHRAKIAVNGRTYEPDLFLLGAGGAHCRFAKNISLKIASLGFRLFELPVNPSDYEREVGVYDFTCVEKDVSALLKHIPAAYVSLNLNLDLPKWCAANPDETIKYADPQPGIKAGDEFNGTPIRASAASRKYRAEVDRVIRKLAERVTADKWGKRVVMVRVDWGVYTEWHMFGMKNAPDVSRPMVDAFGRQPPPVEVRRREKRVLDENEDAELIAWNLHQQNEISDMLIGFAGAVKRYLPGRLAGAYYGYIWDIFWPEGSNCFLGKVLDAPVIDFLSAPSPYFGSVRFGGGSYHSRSIPDAFRRRGKLFMCEDDTRHYHTKGWAFKRHLVETAELSAAVMKRNYLNKLFDGGGIQFCDPFYGVGLRLNTFDDPVVLKALKASMDVIDKVGQVAKGTDADVIVVVSERERLMRDSHIETAPDMHWRNLYSYLPDHLYRSGVLFDTQRLEDFLADSSKPKAVVLLNIYHLTVAEKEHLSRRLEGVKVLDFTRAEVPATAEQWRSRFEAQGIVPAAPVNTYCRRQGNLLLFHTGTCGKAVLSPGIADAVGFTELFSGRRFVGGDQVEVDVSGPDTLLLRAEFSR